MLTVLVALGLTRDADRAILAAVQSVRAPLLDTLATALSVAADALPVYALLGVIAIASLRRNGVRACVPLLLLVAATLVEAALKTAVAHPGPPHELSRSTELPAWIPWPRAHFENAYPSGHALRAAFLLVLALGERRAIVTGAAAFAIAVWISRVYAAEHWPSDVLGGILLGLVAAGIARHATSRRELIRSTAIPSPNSPSDREPHQAKGGL